MRESSNYRKECQGNDAGRRIINGRSDTPLYAYSDPVIFRYLVPCELQATVPVTSLPASPAVGVWFDPEVRHEQVDKYLSSMDASEATDSLQPLLELTHHALRIVVRARHPRMIGVGRQLPPRVSDILCVSR
jgi:hypothetical protein